MNSINLEGVKASIQIENCTVPRGVLEIIFHYLKFEELVNCTLTCKNFYKCISENKILLERKKLAVSFKDTYEKFNRIIDIENSDNTATILKKQYRLATSNESLLEEIKNFYENKYEHFFNKYLSSTNPEVNPTLSKNPNTFIENKILNIHPIDRPFNNFIQISVKIFKKNLLKSKSYKEIKSLNKELPQNFHLILFKEESFLRFKNIKKQYVPSRMNILINSCYHSITAQFIESKEILSPKKLVNKKIKTKTKIISIKINSFSNNTDCFFNENYICKIDSIVTNSLLKKIMHVEAKEKENCVIN